MAVEPAIHLLQASLMLMDARIKGNPLPSSKVLQGNRPANSLPPPAAALLPNLVAAGRTCNQSVAGAP